MRASPAPGAAPELPPGGAERRRLALGYFWYFSTVGLMVPYWPPFLAMRGLDPVEIGLVMGIFAAMRVIGPPAYAHWADVSGRRLALLRAASLVALCCALTFAWLDTPWSIALSLAVYSAAWNGVMSVYDAHVLQRTGADSGRYGTLRLWGSVGFIVVAATAGWLLDLAGLDALPWLLAGLIVMTWTTLRGPEPEHARPLDERPLQFRALAADRRVRVFLLVAFLMIASHGAYYNFFSIHLAAAGYGRTAIGLLWSWAVIAEIGVFLAARHLLARFSLRALTVTALVATGLRWIMLALWPGFVGIVFAAQTLHLASFGLFHLCSVAIAGRLFPSGAGARGQALYGSVGYGLGGMVGAIGSGWLWREFSPEAAFLAGAGLALAAAALAATGLRGLPAGDGQGNSDQVTHP